MTTEDVHPTASLVLGQFSLRRKDLPFKEEAETVENKVYRSRRTDYLYIYSKERDHWQAFAEDVR